MFGLGRCFVIQYFVSFFFCNHLDGEVRASRFTLSFFLMSCDCKCYVDRPHGAMVLTAVCDSGIS